MESINLTDHFLIAMPAMADPYFARSLVYICEHNEQGALGMIINRPLDMNIATLFDKVDIALNNGPIGNLPVYFGGPVQTDRGFVLHRPRGEWQSTMAVNDGVALTSSRDILEAIGQRGEPHELLISLGYAGWAAGQLEYELGQNAWLTVKADAGILFEMPYEERLPAAMQRLGIDFAHLAEDAGHA